MKNFESILVAPTFLHILKSVCVLFAGYEAGCQKQGTDGCIVCCQIIMLQHCKTIYFRSMQNPDEENNALRWLKMNSSQTLKNETKGKKATSEEGILNCVEKQSEIYPLCWKIEA